MKNRFLLVLPVLLSLVACSNNGASGQPQEQDPNVNIYHGKGAPSNSLGQDYSHYYDEDSHYVYEKKDGKWINQLTYGSSSLYETKNTTRRIKKSLPSGVDVQELKDAIMMSFYSTNATCFMNGYQDGSSEDSGSYANTKLNERNVEVVDREGNHQSYVKIGEDGFPYVYQDGQYVKNEMMGCELPHPTYDNLAYELMLIYDDELGEQTSIICGNIEKASYNAETGFYSIENISIHHNARTTVYFTDPISDNMTLNFKFKLSSDKTYVDYAELKIVHSENKNYFDNLVTNYHFSNMHTTVVEMPE